MIEIAGINKRFGKLKVLKDINLQLSDGNIVALIGPNACGKTTLIKTILGMVIPDSGEITVNGQATKEEWEYRKHIGYMPQIGRFPDNMTVVQVLDMIQNIRSDKARTLDMDLYEGFQLHNILGKKMATLSGGTRQKVSAQIAFLFKPQILILDEPTAGLDPLSAAILKEKIQAEKEKGKLILITSHVLSELDSIVNQIVYMQEGRIIFNKPFEQLKTDTGKAQLSDAIAHIMKSATL